VHDDIYLAAVVFRPEKLRVRKKFGHVPSDEAPVLDTQATEWQGKHENTLVVIPVLITIFLLGRPERLPAPLR
jgi:hypothetical protein